MASRVRDFTVAVVTVMAAAALLFSMLTAGAAQPEFNVKEDWVYYESGNKTRWYFKADSVFLIQSVPDEYADQTGNKTLVHFVGNKTLRTPLSAKEFYERFISEQK